jgi:hypothetical protein
MRLPLVIGALTAVLAVGGCSRTDSPAGPSDATTPSPSRSTTTVPPDGGRYAGSRMCQDFRDAGGRLDDVRTGDRYGAALWRKLAADAPPPIKPDARVVAEYVAGTAAGRPDLANLSKAMTALGRVSDWATGNCI